MISWKLPLVPSDTYNIMKMSVAVRAHFFLFISVAHMNNACTTRHSHRNTVVGKDANIKRDNIIFQHWSIGQCWKIIRPIFWVSVIFKSVPMLRLEGSQWVARLAIQLGPWSYLANVFSECLVNRVTPVHIACGFAFLFVHDMPKGVFDISTF